MSSASVPQTTPASPSPLARNLAILVAALGYFVDVYDLILFSVIRVPSLQGLGYSGDALMSQGLLLLNSQMAGMLVGGIAWGVLGDKRGRVAVLFGSIFLYSVANILNAFVYDTSTYALLRFLAGFGLAGELGAGITLVSEIMPAKSRGYATTIVATVGVAGAIAASLVGQLTDWRTAYIIGGGMGIVLLVLRLVVCESAMFNAMAKGCVRRGDLLLLFKNRERFFRYLRCILIGVPIWYAIGLIVTFSPEVGRALDMFIIPSAGQAILFAYIGLVIGDLMSGLLSQYLRSRRLPLYIFILITTLTAVFMLTYQHPSLFEYYVLCGILGFGTGYWAVFITNAAEQFGTNLRATVATTAPNFVRGSVLALTAGMELLRPTYGLLTSILYVGAIVTVLALWALLGLRETYGKELDYTED
jgi:putative MFS transporter